MPDETGPQVRRLEAETGRFDASFNVTVTAEVVTYPQKLLAFAEELIRLGEHSLSIVTAHIACEVATDRTFSKAFRAKGIEYLEDSVSDLLPSNNLGNERVAAVYMAITGDIINQQPFWARFKESATRRNRVSHNGQSYGQADAEASLAVAKEFVAHLGR
jgi:hypothetical protein